MSGRRPKPVIPRTDITARLRTALLRLRKAELADILLELAREDHRILRQLALRLELAAAPDELVTTTRQAIADATAFDERDANRNFDFDSEAYSDVKRSLIRLTADGHLREAMQLALELMQRGSHQVEMSDEGLMTGEIEDCLGVVIRAVQKGDLPAGDVIAWCSAMLDSDRVGFIAEAPLRALQQRFGTRPAQSSPPDAVV